MEEQIVFVNELGEPSGETGPKLASHHDKTRLHLAFSCYVFNEKGELLITQRAHSKKVWPGVWTNSVCGHPGPGEAMIDAIKRRLDYELGMTARNFEVVLPNYRYKTPPYMGIIENEFCPVFVARATSQPQPNISEVANARWMSWSQFISEAEGDSDDYSMYVRQMSEAASGSIPKYSWWCKDQLKQLKSNPLIQLYAQPISS